MNYRSSAAALMAAITFASPSNAATYTQAQVEMMVNSLEATEAAKQYATVKVLAECPDWDGDQGRFYYGRKPSIQICAPMMDSPFDVQGTVQHEAVHLAQWCRGSDSIYVISAIKKEDRKDWGADLDHAHKMAKQYDASRYDAEFEAYYFMDSSGSDIAEMVKEECK